MNAAERYLKICHDEWTGRVHPNGTPCLAEPGKCPLEKKFNKVDSLSESKNDKINSIYQLENENNECEIHKQVSGGALQELQEGDGLLERLANVARGVCKTSNGTEEICGRESQRKEAAKQEEAIRDFAKQNGLWIDNADLEFDKKYGEGVSGSEAIAYYDGNRKTVHKIISDNFYASPLENLRRISLHNRYFPETALTLRGVGTIGSEWMGSRFAFIVDQPLIRIQRSATEDEVSKHLKGIGFHRINEDAWCNSDNSVTISDLHEENVVVSYGGNVYVIDADIRNTNEK